MQASPYALLGASRLTAARDMLERALSAWAADWGLSEPEVTVERAWEAAPHSAPWQYARAGTDGRGLWLAWPAELAGQLQRQMFAPDRRHAPQQGQPALALAAADAALAALADGLARETLGQTVALAAQAPNGLRGHASGALAFELRTGKLACHGLLNHEAVQHLAPPRAAAPALPAVSLAALLAQQPVALQVAVGQAQVTLGSLLALEAGDVIRLDSLAEDALAVRDDKGRLLFGGHLGIAGNKLALEVVPGTKNGVKA